MTEVTRILNQIEDGDPSAADQLLPLVYDELRKLATARYRSRSKVQIQAYLSAMVQNLKRLVFLFLLLLRLLTTAITKNRIHYVKMN